MAKKTLLPVIFLLLLTVLNRQGAIAIATEAKELARQAEEKLNQGSRLAGADKMAEATVCFQQAAELYEQAIQKDPNDKASRQNYLYCLGERGMIYIRKGQQSLKDKKYALAADCYSAAITAYDSALKKLPQEKNFQTNRRYCRQFGRHEGPGSSAGIHGRLVPHLPRQPAHASANAETVKGQRGADRSAVPGPLGRLEKERFRGKKPDFDAGHGFHLCLGRRGNLLPIRLIQFSANGHHHRQGGENHCPGAGRRPRPGTVAAADHSLALGPTKPWHVFCPEVIRPCV
jgi:tetratricopeptide (TPR) repeat protein